MKNWTDTNTINRIDVSYSMAQQLICEIQAECEQRGISLSTAVVDNGGNLVAAARMDEAQLGSLNLAIDKAYTAVSFGFPTSAWADSTTPGGSDWGLGHTLGGRAIVFPGGVPLYLDQKMIGALGVSGAASTVDESCALSAIAACGLEAKK